MWSSRRFPARKDSRRSFKVILTRPLISFEEKIISFQRHLSSRHYKPKHLIKSKIKPLQYEVVLPAVRQILLFGQNSPEEDYRLETKNYLFHSLLRASLTYQDKKKDSVDDTLVCCTVLYILPSEISHIVASFCVFCKMEIEYITYLHASKYFRYKHGRGFSRLQVFSTHGAFELFNGELR